MKPYKNFLFVLSILLILAWITLVLGGRKINLGPSLSFKIPDYSFYYTGTENAPVERKPFLTDEEIAAFLAVDSTALNYAELNDVPFYPLEIPADALDPFFEDLKSLTDSNFHVRILHYGDSQIEADRISSAIRHYMQSTFGGRGMGLLPLTSSVHASSCIVDISNEWEKVSIVDPEKKSNFSMTMGYLTSEQRATMDVRKSPYALYPTSQAFTEINILSSSRFNPKSVFAKTNADSIYFDKQQVGRYYALTKLPVDTLVKQVSLHFEEQESPNKIYGISLDADHGISLDNIPLRGSAGYIFTRNHADFLQEGLLMMNTRLILFQFGVNVMPNADEIMTNAKAFEDALVKQLSFLKSIAPNIPVVVIGVSDRSIKRGERFETNPNVPLVIEAQRQAAKRTGCVFWDLFEAMGGENSMLDWVGRKPALGTRDYIHFTAKGAQRVGEMFYKSLMMAYLEYCYKQNEKALEEKFNEWNEEVSVL